MTVVPGPHPDPPALPPPAQAWQPRRYPLALRGPRHRWWRPLLGLAIVLGCLGLLVVATVVVGFVMALVAGVDLQDERAYREVLDDWSVGPWGLLVTNLMLAAGIGVAMLAVWAAHRWPPGYVSAVVGRVRWRWLLICLIPAVGVMAPWTVVQLVWDDVSWSPEPRWPLLLLVVVLTTPLQAAGEEYLFRGWLTQAVGSWFARPVVGALVAGLVSTTLFAFAHGQQDVWLFADRFAFGAVAAWLVWRTGGLEAGIAVHAVNNLVVFFTSIALGELSESLLVTQADPVLVGIDVATLLLIGAVIDRVAARRRVVREVAPGWPVTRTAPPPGAPSAAAASATRGRRVRAVLLDLDDTIVDTRAAFRDAVRAALDMWMPDLDEEDRERAVLRWATDPLEAFARFTRGETDFRGQRALRIRDLHEQFAGPPVDDALVDAWTADYDAALRAGWRAHADAVRLIGWLHARGVPVGVVTNMYEPAQREKLQVVGLGWVPILGSLETVGVGKPDPRVWQVACARLGLRPDQVAYVGDEPQIDAVGASRAGLLGVWLDRGHRVAAPRTSWEPETPAARITSLDALPELLGWVPPGWTAAAGTWQG